MNQSEIRGKVTAMADLFGARAPGDAALKLWVESLADLDAVALATAFDRWPQSHSKMPTPADIRKDATAIASYWLEAEARRHAEEEERNRGQSIDTWARKVAPKNVRLALKAYRDACADPEESDRRWIDRVVAYWARGFFYATDYKVERNAAGQVTRVTPRTIKCPVTTAHERVVRRRFGGELPDVRDKRVQLCLASIQRQEERERLAPSFAVTLENLEAMDRASASRVAEPPEWV